MSSIGLRRKNARRESGPAYEERRQRLLAGAAEVFREKGYHAVSINDIAEKFGGDRASVYYYYGSKHEIFTDLIQQAVNEVVVQAESIASSSEPAEMRLERLLVSTVESYERHYPYMFVYIQEDMTKVRSGGAPDESELLQLTHRFERALLRIVEDGVRAGSFRSDVDVRLLVFGLVGAMNWTHRWFVPGGRASGQEVGRALADMFLRGVEAPGSVRDGQGTRQV